MLQTFTLYTFQLNFERERRCKLITLANWAPYEEHVLRQPVLGFLHSLAAVWLQALSASCCLDKFTRTYLPWKSWHGYSTVLAASWTFQSPQLARFLITDGEFDILHIRETCLRTRTNSYGMFLESRSFSYSAHLAWVLMCMYDYKHWKMGLVIARSWELIEWKSSLSFAYRPAVKESFICNKFKPDQSSEPCSLSLRSWSGDWRGKDRPMFSNPEDWSVQTLTTNMYPEWSFNNWWVSPSVRNQSVRESVQKSGECSSISTGNYRIYYHRVDPHFKNERSDARDLSVCFSEWPLFSTCTLLGGKLRQRLELVWSLGKAIIDCRICG